MADPTLQDVLNELSKLREEMAAIRNEMNARFDALEPSDEDEDGEEEEQAADDGEQDAMYDDAVRVVVETRRCSTSWLQRKLGLGYNRAARIVDMLEVRGLVGPANDSKDREVLTLAAADPDDASDLRRGLRAP